MVLHIQLCDTALHSVSTSYLVIQWSLIEFLIPREVRKRVSRTAPWTSEGQTLAWLGDWLTLSLGRQVLRGKGAQEGWSFFDREILKAEEPAVPICKRWTSGGSQPGWTDCFGWDNAFFTAVFNGKSSCSWSIWPVELEDKTGSRMKLHNPRGIGH